MPRPSGRATLHANHARQRRRRPPKQRRECLMTEPAAGIFAALFVLFAAFMVLLTVYARIRRKPRIAAIFGAVLTLFCLDMALIEALTNTALLLGIPADLRWRVALI